jgi:hypothetical protein
MKKATKIAVLSIIIIFMIVQIKNYYATQQVIKLNKSYAEASFVPSSIRQYGINTTIKELYSFSSWRQTESETMRYSILFTDTEYCSYPADIDYIKHHPDLIDNIIIGRYSADNNEVYLEGEKEPYKFSKNSTKEIYDNSGKYLKTLKGMFLYNENGSLSQYTNGTPSTLAENRKVLYEFKMVSKKK